eukprot:218742_1
MLFRRLSRRWALASKTIFLPPTHKLSLSPIVSRNLSTKDNETSSQPPSKSAHKHAILKVLRWDGLIAKYGPHYAEAQSMTYNRWHAVPYAVSTHLCLGACYAWSIFNEPLSRELGVVAASSQDWLLPQVVTTFTTIIISQGLAMFCFGKWVERAGARISGVTGALLYGSGMLLGAAGVYTHQLPLLYTGYGVLAGCGMGLAYLPPVATLIRWFPDRRGLATGMAICGFGGGAVLIVSLKKMLLARNFVAPQYLGQATDVITKRSDTGSLLAEVGDKWMEVVNVTASEVSHIATNAANTLHEGIYVVGTGSTGVAATMGTLGLGYLAITLTSGMCLKTPPKGWLPDSMRMDDTKSAPTSSYIVRNVHVDDVMKTPQFWLMATTFLSTATVGMGLMSCAKDVLGACLSSSPLVAAAGGTAAFAATYVQFLAMGNLSGRFVWASVSDKVGRKNIFSMFTCVGAPLYFSLPWMVANAVGAESYAPLVLFYGSTIAIISFFGAGYSTVPAYESDIFGSKYIAAVHGRIMIASALSGLLGPMIFTKLHDREERKAINELVKSIDSGSFLDKFGSPMTELQTLIEAKAVNIPRLLELCPVGTVDPTPYLYDPAFRTMGVALGIGALANFAIKPVDPKYHEKQ